jgi:hypothetical protein
MMQQRCLEQRHRYFQKRMVLNVLYKNWKVQPILAVYRYVKMQEKPALALSFIAVLQKNDGLFAVSKSFRSWIAYVRRRRHWHHFVFSNCVISDYTPTKRKALAALQHRPVPTVCPISLFSGRFRRETMAAYSDVMTSKVDRNAIFLLVTSDNPPKVTPPKNQNEQRRTFFKIWRSLPPENSLLTRLIAIHTSKVLTERANLAESLAERTFRAYRISMALLSELRLASGGKFAAARKTINENNSRMFRNRNYCLHRDQILLYSHESHANAVGLHQIGHFRATDAVKAYGGLPPSEGTQPIISLASLAAVMEQPDEPVFIKVRGCRAPLTSFKGQIHEVHQIIHQDLVRSEVGAEVSSRFARLAGPSQSSTLSFGGARSLIRAELFSKQKRLAKQKRSAINHKLLESFPAESRKAKTLNGSLAKKAKYQEEDISPKQEGESRESAELLLKEQLPTFANLLTDATNMVLGSSSSGTDVEDVPENLRASLSGRISTGDLLNSLSARTADQERLLSPHEINESLLEGYNDVVLNSVAGARPIQDQQTQKKYQIFLEILFERGIRDSPYAIALKRKLQQVRGLHKQSMAACGIITTGLLRPVSGLMERFRADRGPPEPPTLTRSTQAEGPKQGDVKTFPVIYHGRRYRALPPTASDLDSVQLLRSPALSASGDVSGYASGEEWRTGQRGLYGREGGDEEELGEWGDGEMIDEVTGQVIKKARKRRAKPGFGLNTPYSSQGIHDDSALARINKIALAIIAGAVVDDPTLGMLVDVDPLGVPPLPLESIPAPTEPQVVEQEPKGPGYRTRHPHKVVIAPTKKTVPIVSQMKSTLTEDQKKQITEGEDFAQITLTDGTSKYKRSRMVPQKQLPKYPAFKPPSEPTPPPLWPEGKVVSFRSGSRQVGTDTPDFVQVRIQQGKQRGITRPVTANLKISESRPVSKVAKSRVDLSRLKPMVTDVVRMIAESKDRQAFVMLKAKIQQMRKKINLDDRIKQSELFSQLQTVHILADREKNAMQSTYAMLDLARGNHHIVHMLWEAIDLAIRQRIGQRMRTPSRSTVDPCLYCDISWMADNQLRYKAVAIMYNPDNSDELDAVVAPTEPTAKREKTPHSRSEVGAPRNWDTVLGTYDLSELLAVTPYVFPEAEVDDFLQNYQRSLSLSMH